MNKKCPTCGKDLPPINEPDGSTRYECACIIGHPRTVLHIVPAPQPAPQPAPEKPSKEK